LRIGGGMVAEKKSVWRFFQLGDHAAHVREEAHVEHPVGFVEHEDLHVAQVDIASVHQVE